MIIQLIDSLSAKKSMEKSETNRIIFYEKLSLNFMINEVFMNLTKIFFNH